MLATQDVYDIEVPDEVLLTRAERLVEMGRGISLMQLMFAKAAAEFAATNDYELDGSVSPIDWIRFHCHLTGPQAANYVAAGEHFDAPAQHRVGHGRGQGWLRPHGGDGQDRQRPCRLTDREGVR
jgi:hypothetical protein